MALEDQLGIGPQEDDDDQVSQQQPKYAQNVTPTEGMSRLRQQYAPGGVRETPIQGMNRLRQKFSAPIEPYQPHAKGHRGATGIDYGQYGDDAEPAAEDYGKYGDDVEPKAPQKPAVEPKKTWGETAKDIAGAAAGKVSDLAGAAVHGIPVVGPLIQGAQALGAEGAATVGKSAAQVPTDIAGQTLKGMGIGANQFTRSQIGAMDRIDRGEKVTADQDPIGYSEMSPEQRQQVRQQIEAQTKTPEDNPLYKAGKATQEWGQKTFPLSKEEQQSIPSRVTKGLVTTGALVGLGLVSPTAAMVGGASVFGAMGAAETYDDARAKGADPDTAAKAAGLSAAMNAALGVIPLGSVLTPITKLIPGMESTAIRMLVEAAKNGFVFASVGEAQEYLGQQIAKLYNPQFVKKLEEQKAKAEAAGDTAAVKEIDDHIKEASGYSLDAKRLIANLLTGAALGAGHAALEGRGAKPKVEPRDEEETKPDEETPPGVRPPGPGETETETDSGIPPGATDNGDGTYTDSFGRRRDKQTHQRTADQGGGGNENARQQQQKEQQRDWEEAQRTGNWGAFNRKWGPGAEQQQQEQAKAAEGARAEWAAQWGQKPAEQEDAATTKRRAKFEKIVKSFGFSDEDLKNASTADLREYVRVQSILAAHGHSKEDISRMSPKDMQDALAEATRHGASHAQEEEEAPAAEQPQAEQPKAKAEQPPPEEPVAEQPTADGTRESPADLKSEEDLATAAAAADQDHTHAQGEANNVPRGHAKWQGLDLTIETPPGGTRKGLAPDGTPWETTHGGTAYGYFRGLPEGADGMHPDVHVGPDLEGDHGAYVIDELDPDSGKFRQTKTVIGVPSEAAARKAYLDTSSKTPKMIGDTKHYSAEDFVKMAREGGLSRPAAARATPDQTEGGASPPDTGIYNVSRKNSVTEQHRAAVADALRAQGDDPAKIDPATLERAAQLHASGIPPEEAIPAAVIQHLVASGDINATDAKAALGEESDAVLHAGGTSEHAPPVEPAGSTSHGPTVAAEAGGTAQRPKVAGETKRPHAAGADEGRPGQASAAGHPEAGAGAAVRPIAGGKRPAEVGEPGAGEHVQPEHAAAGETTKRPAKTPVKPRRAQSLVQFIAQRGGISRNDPLIKDVQTILGRNNLFVPGYGPLIRKGGEGLDKLREAAVEAKYIHDIGAISDRPATSTISTLLEHLEKEIRGETQYPAGEEPTGPTAEQRERAKEQQAEIDEAKKRIVAELKAMNYPVDGFLGDHMERAAQLMVAHDLEPGDALDQAAVQLEQEEGLVTSTDDDYIDFGDLDAVQPSPTPTQGKTAAAEDNAAAQDETFVAAEEGARAQAGGVSSSPRAASSVEPGATGGLSGTGGKPGEPVTEPGAEGKPQLVLPGAERISDTELAKRRAAERLKPAVAQKPADEGLFGDESQQTDLVDLAKKPEPEIKGLVERIPGKDGMEVLIVRNSDSMTFNAVLRDKEAQETVSSFVKLPSIASARTKAKEMLEGPEKPSAKPALSVDQATKNLEASRETHRKIKRQLDAIDSKLEGEQPKPRNALDKERLDRIRAFQERIARSLRKKEAAAMDGVDDAKAALKKAKAAQPASVRAPTAEPPAAPRPAPTETPSGEMPDIPPDLVRKPKAEAPEAGPSDSGAIKLAQSLKSLIAGHHPITPKVLQDEAEKAFGSTLAEGKFDRKDMYDALELAINLRIKEEPSLRVDGKMGPFGALNKLREILDKIPTQTVRSEEQISFQQFSTPPDYSAAVAYVANLRDGDVALEPSAGTGSIVAASSAPGVKIIANELSDRRADMLRALVGKDGRVTTENAEQINNILPKDIKPTVVVMNPPFSQTAGRMGDKRDVMVGANHIRQALNRLEPNGRLVAIVGRGMAMDAIRFRDWFREVEKNHSIRANIGVSGDVYKKYGTNFGTRLLVIDKVPSPTLFSDRQKPVLGEAQTVADLMRMLEPIRNARPTAQPSPERQPAQSGGPQVVNAGEGARPSTLPPSVEPSAVGTGKRGGGGVAGPGQAGGGGATGTSVPVEAPGRPDVAPGKPGGGIAGGATAEPAAKPPVGAKPQAGGGAGPERDLQPPAGGEPGAAPGGERVEVEQAKPGSQGASAISDSLYESYEPQRLRVKGAKKHPGPLVESAAMSSVEPPAPTYKPAFPKAVIDSGLLSLPQIEAVVYAGQAHQSMLPAAEGVTPRRKGYFIGDGTGVGKGREVAGIILDNWHQGRTKAVWVSEKKKLLNDAKRDWSGLGQNPNHLFNAGKVKAGEPIDAEKGVAFITYDTLKGGMSDQAALARGEYVRGQKVTVNGKAGEIASTKVQKDRSGSAYRVKFEDGTVQAVPTYEIAKVGEESAVKTRVDQLADWFGKDFDGVIAFDEAHNMGNAMSTKGDRGEKDAAQKALAGLALQDRLPNARVVYVSATGATEVSNLAYADRLGLWGRGTPFADRKNFINEVSGGGIAAMELIARDMKQLGLYTARNLSYDGVEYSRLEHKLNKDQREIYDTLAEAWQVVLRNIHEALKTTEADSRAKAAAMSAFWGGHQRFFNQVITSLQMPSVIKAAEKDLDVKRQVVLQLTNTNEASQERAAAKAETAEDIEDLDITPRDQIIQLVEHSFPTQQYETYVDESGNKGTRPVVDSEGNPVQNADAVAARDRLIDQLASIRVPQGPLDMILDHFGIDNVAEVTGRKRRFVLKEDEKTGEKRRVEDSRPGSANQAETDAFQAAKKKVLVFSEAGGTGASYHADNTSASKNARRAHYLVQAGWRADKAVQGFGRTHRTNQGSAPIFHLVTTDLDGQKRFISSIARRLGQLGALTKGQRQAGDQGVFSQRDNLESTEAKTALRQFFSDLYFGHVEDVAIDEFEKQTGLQLRIVDKEGRFLGLRSDLPPITQFLNRLLSLKIDLQNKVFRAFSDRLDSVIEARQQAGLLDVGLETVRADKIAKDSEQTVHTDKETGAETKHVKLTVSNRFHPTDFDSVARNSNRPVQFWTKSPQGHVFAVAEAPHLTDANTGGIIPQYRLIGPASGRPIERFKLDERGSKWDKIEKGEAEKLWQDEIAKAPEFISRDLHLITGAILPIWDRLKGSTRVVRLNTDDGERLIGRVVPESKIAETLRALGAEAKGAAVAPERLFSHIMNGGRAKLANGWTLMRRMVAGEQRIELKGPSSFSEGQQIKQDGVFSERIAYETRYFIPTDPERGAKVLAAVTEHRPVIEMGGGEQAAGLSAPESRLSAPAARITESPAFKHWFGDSKIVDAKGNPLVVYHGTDAQFERFDRYFLGSVSDTSDAKAGFWFTSSEDRAHQAARDAMASSGTNVPYIKKVYLKIEKPAIVPSIRNRLPDDVARLAKRAQKAGHDGVIFREGEKSGADYLVFDPEQIRTAVETGLSAPEPRLSRAQTGEAFDAWRARSMFTPDPAKPLGQQAQSFVLTRGLDTGNEHLVAIDADGKVAAQNQGTAHQVPFTRKLERRLADPGESIVLHHNHPTRGMLSVGDLAALGRPGLAAIWAHGRNGEISRAGLTPEAKKALAQYRSDEERMRAISNLAEAIHTFLLPRSQLIVLNRLATLDEANFAHDHIHNLVLHQGGLIDLHHNINLGDYIEHTGFAPYILRAVNAIREALFNEHTDQFRRPDRQPGPLSHAGDLGTSLGRPEEIVRQYRQQTGDRTNRGADRTTQAGAGAGLSAPRNRAREPEEEAVLNRIVPSEKGSRLPKSPREIYTATFDDLNPLDWAVKQMAMGAKLSTEQNAYKLARLTRGSLGRGEQFLLHGTYDYETLRNNGLPLDKVLEPVKHDLDGFRAFIVAKRAIELEGRGIDTGVPLADAQQVVARGQNEFGSVQRELVAYQDRVLEYLQKSGILSVEGVRAMRAANMDYVPFFRLMAGEKDLGHSLGGGLKVRDPVKGIKGSELLIIDPIESIIKNTYLMIALAERNRALRAFEDLANLSPIGKDFMVKVRRKVHPVEISAEEINRHLHDEGIDDEVSDSMTVFRPNAFNPNPDEIAIYRNGKRNIYKVGKEIAEAVNALDRDTINMVTRFLSIPARTLRAGAVLAPEFIFRNPVRDQFSAFAFSEAGYIPVYDFVRGLGQLFKKGASENYQSWLKGGGANAAMVAIDRDYIGRNILRLEEPTVGKRVIKTAKTPFEALRILSEIFENGTRLGEANKLLRRGESPFTAAYSSREVTLDFARMGSQTKSINALISFWNAQLQGVDRAARQFKEHPFKTLLIVALSIAVPSILLWMINHDDERYKELPRWEKDYYWHIITDNWENVTPEMAAKYPEHYKRQVGDQWQINNGTIWRIPKPFELGVLFGSLPERILDAFFTDVKNPYKGIGDSAIKALMPPYLPQILAPMIEQFANRSTFFDRPIVPGYLKDVMPKYQAQPYTSETAKAIGALVSKISESTSFASPLIIENYIRDWTGGLGMHIIQATEWALHQAGVLEPKNAPESTLADMPVIKGFVSRFPSAGGASVQDFYDTYAERKMARSTVSFLKKGGRGDESKDEADRHATVTQEKIHKAMGNQFKAIRNIYADPKMPPRDKRQIIDSIYLQMIELAKRGNSGFERTEKNFKREEERATAQ